MVIILSPQYKSPMYYGWRVWCMDAFHTCLVQTKIPKAADTFQLSGVSDCIAFNKKFNKCKIIHSVTKAWYSHFQTWKVSKKLES